MGEFFVNGNVAYIPQIARLTRNSKNVAQHWKDALYFDANSYEQVKLRCVVYAKKAFDIAETAHKKCAIASEYGIARDAKLQRQIVRAVSDAVAHFHPDCIDRDLSAISDEIKENDFGGVDTDFYKVYKECSKANGSRSYDAYLASPSVPDALKRKLEAIQ